MMTVGELVTAGIRIDYVDTHPYRQVVSAVVTHQGGRLYLLGHLPGEGWFCTCTRSKRCPHIKRIQDLIPGITPAANPASAPTDPPTPDGITRE